MSKAVPKKRAFVCVVDDDESVRESMPELLEELGYCAVAFSSGDDLFASEEIRRADCFVLDVSMPGMTGPQVHQKLKYEGYVAPVIFITAHVEAARVPLLIGHGAVACLIKPFNDIALLEALTFALKAE